jgi:hypothetical protein
MNRLLNRRKIQHLIEIHLETCWVQRSLTTFLVAKSFLSSPYLDQSSFGLYGNLGKVNFVSGSIQILKTIEIEINKTGWRRINGIFVPNFLILNVAKLFWQ